MDTLIVVAHGDRLNEAAQFLEVTAAVQGGGTRQESVRAGLRALPEGTEFVLIHDGARPFISQDLIARVIQSTQEHGAATPALAVTDTIRQGNKTLDRSQLHAVQTPQGFRVSDLLKAYENPQPATDDAGLMDQAGFPVALVEGDRRNIKLTTIEDYELALRMIQVIPETRTGLGYDIHAFSQDPTRPLWLGGVQFEGAPGLEGHSDADALLHAVVDALLGAAGMGDIGLLYPNTDPEWKDVRSTRFLEETAARLRAEAWEIVHLDATILAEVPKVMPRSHDIKQAIALATGIDPGCVSIKATTNEKLGAIGRSEGIAAMAVATIRRFPTPGV